MNTDRGCAPLSFSCLLHAVFACSMRCGSMPMYRWEAGGRASEGQVDRRSAISPLIPTGFSFCAAFSLSPEKKKRHKQNTPPRPAGQLPPSCISDLRSTGTGGCRWRTLVAALSTAKSSRIPCSVDKTVDNVDNFQGPTVDKSRPGGQKRNRDRWAFLAGAPSAR